jgi:hypothetical protein
VGRFRDNGGAVDQLTESLRQNGYLVETAVFGLSESWWFQNEHISESGALISATANWLAAAVKDWA